jgi:hypothetical protein
MPKWAISRNQTPGELDRRLKGVTVEVHVMPRVTLKTGIAAPDGREEELSEYLCDWPECPNVATQVLGCIKELALAAVMCDEHATGRAAQPQLTAKKARPSSERP